MKTESAHGRALHRRGVKTERLLVQSDEKQIADAPRHHPRLGRCQATSRSAATHGAHWVGHHHAVQAGTATERIGSTVCFRWQTRGSLVQRHRMCVSRNTRIRFSWTVAATEGMNVHKHYCAKGKQSIHAATLPCPGEVNDRNRYCGAGENGAGGMASSR